MRIAKDKHEQKTIDDIRDYGVHIMHVHDDDQQPGFTYSVGLFETYAHPEVIIFGLKIDLSSVLIKNMAYDIKEGKTFTGGEFHADVLDDFLCYFDLVDRSHYREYVGWNRWFYEGDNFPLLQCVYPTVQGIFPWKEFSEDTRWFCPMLIAPPKEH